jgi:outer membrane biosynthesis protein TonB
LLAPTRPRIGNGRWIAALAIGLLLLVVLAAWWGHRNRSIAIDEPTPAAIGSSMASSSAPAEPTVPEAQAQPAIPPAPPAVIAEKLEPLASAAPETAKPAPKPRKAAKKQAEAPVAVVQETAPAAPAPTPEPVRPPSPQESCAGRNFIATAQCMAAQCARPEVAGHAQCEAVRRQQRIDEEKRNPTMAN